MLFNDRRATKKAAPKPSMNPAMSEDGKSYQVSKNVTVRGSAKMSLAGNAGRGKIDPRDLKGAAQAVRENVNAVTPISKSEAKANARGLKAANPKKQPSALSQKIAKKMYPAGVPKDNKGGY
jgi:hypothetical protein